MNTQTSPSETLLCRMEGKKNTLKCDELFFSLLLPSGKKGVALNTVHKLEEVTQMYST